MTHFLLLHGSWHGAWCWHKVIPRLQAAGHQTTAIDLPGRGRSPAVPATVTLDHMVQTAASALFPTARTTIVVHSRSGIIASTLAERVPDRIERIIYLAAFMLRSRRRVVDYVPDHDALITDRIEVNRSAGWDWLDPDVYREGLYADCDESDIELARALLVREPVRPALTPLELSDHRYGRVPRAYIRLTRDRAVSLPLQDRLLSETRADRVENIEGCHSVYFSQPERLTQTISKLSGE